MNKRIISLVLTICIIITAVAPAVKGAEPVKEYYGLTVTYSEDSTTTYQEDVAFMLRSESAGADPVVYIKAEDLGKIVRHAGYSQKYQNDLDPKYVYGQTFTECAFVSDKTDHVIRFLFGSDKVAVIYVKHDLVYTAPHPTLYEDEVVWIPFEFALQLFYMKAVPTDTTIHITGDKYNPVSICNVVHEDIRKYGFSWFDEVGQTDGEYLASMSGGIILTYTNKLLSFEPSEWGAVMAASFNTYFVDAGMAEDLSKAFLTPSEQETQELDERIEKIATYGYKMFETYEKTGKPLEIPENATLLEVIDKMLTAVPELKKDGVVQTLKKATKNADFKRSADEIVKSVRKSWDTTPVSNGFKVAGGIANAAEYLYLYTQKSERASAALKIYGENSKYNEGHVFKDYGSVKNPFFEASADAIKDSAVDLANDAILGGLGVYGVALEVSGFVWSIISSERHIDNLISVADNRTLSEYAIRYQDDCLGVYYDYRVKCGEGNGSNGAALVDMLNAQYAYLKFSYIARNAAEGAFRDKAARNNSKSAKNLEMAEALSEKNKEIAGFLAYMEGELFAPSDVGSYDWDDAPYADVIKGSGKVLDKVEQSTVPKFEFPPFPGAEMIDYIDDDEAIELAKRTTENLTQGMLNSDFVKMMTEAMGVEGDLYTYSVVGHYADGEDIAIVVQMYVAGRPDMLYFVSILGNEVWSGSVSSTEESGYYVYKDLDLLHATYSDMIGALGDLSTQLIGSL